MKKIIYNIWEFIKEYSTFNYHNGKRYRRKMYKHKLDKILELASVSNNLYKDYSNGDKLNAILGIILNVGEHKI